MSTPWVAGRTLSPDEFDCYCKDVKSVWPHPGVRLEDYREVLLNFPLLMKPGVWPKLARLTEKLTDEVLAAEGELLSRSDLYPLLGLPANVEKVLLGCGSNRLGVAGPRVMRFDFYVTTEGWKFSEANPDMPCGYVEAYGYTKPMAQYFSGYASPPNPAARYAQAIRKAVGKDALVAVVLAEGDPYEARQVDVLVKEIEKRGVRAIRATPGRLRWKSGLAVMGRSRLTLTPTLIVRQLIVEQLLRLRRRSLWVPWFCEGRTPVSNPGYSILAESKRFPCVLRDLNAPMSAFQSHSPESRPPNEVPAGSQNQWVFKPALGGAGRGIAVAGVTEKSAFKTTVELSRRHPMKWVAQRRFESVAVPTERGSGHVCLGIYTIDGVAAGAYARIKGSALIDKSALSIPVLIPRQDLAVPDVDR
jgi:hypothetical protein